MSTVANRVLHGWATRRLELMRTRLCDLPVSLDSPYFAPVIARVTRDLQRRGMTWVPPIYLSTGWHCPDRVPLIGIPFSLANRELRRLELEVTEQCESFPEMARLLRHEVGHAYLYALKLYETPEWKRVFGPFSRPYRVQYAIRAGSRQHVRHLEPHYAQKHPDEDFAETFAVWLTPRTQWRKRYAGWAAMRKLEYIDRVMSESRGFQGPVVRGQRLEAVDRMRVTVAEHYERLGYSVEGYDSEAHGYVDEDLKTVLTGARHNRGSSGDEALKRIRKRILDHVVGMLGVRPAQARDLFDKYVERAADLQIQTGRAEDHLLVGVSAMMTSHLLNLKYAGRFTAPSRRVGCR